MSLDNTAIVGMLEQYDKEVKALKKSLAKICWHMRGGVSLNEAMGLSAADRDMFNELINENLETTKKTGLPYF